jgi:hypothetical protein
MHLIPLFGPSDKMCKHRVIFQIMINFKMWRLCYIKSKLLIGRFGSPEVLGIRCENIH